MQAYHRLPNIVKRHSHNPSVTLGMYEKKLQAVNPKLRIKRFGSSMAAVHYGNLHICRVPQGEISKYTVFGIEHGYHDQYKTRMNPMGGYKWKRIIKRGRTDVAKILFAKRFIHQCDIAKLS